MSNVTLSPDKINKRPSSLRPFVSSKCLLNLKSIVAQNVSSNSNNKTSVSIEKQNLCQHSPASIFPPLPLADSILPSQESMNHLENIEEIKRKKSQSCPNRNVLIEYLQKPSNQLNKRSGTTNRHDRSNVENGESKPLKMSNGEKVSEKVNGHEQTKDNQVILQSSIPTATSKDSNYEQYCSETPLSSNNNEPSIIPPLPLNTSMYPFGSSSSSRNTKPLLSFPAQSSNRINEEYLTRMLRIVESSNNTNEHKPIELSIHRRQPIPIHRFDSTSPSISTIDDDEEDDINLNTPIFFVNSSLNKSADSSPSITTSDQTVSIKPRMNERSGKDFSNNKRVTHNHTQYHEPNPRCSISYARLPHALRNKTPSFNHPSQSGSIRSPTVQNPPPCRQYPQFESVRTPVQKSSQSSIPPEVFDCCQTETVSSVTEITTTQHGAIQQNYRRHSTTIENKFNESEARSNYFRDVAKIREIMINASNRLTKDIGSMTPLPIVDTHCHFDLIFDRLHIKHNNLTKYFIDYDEFYPSGLSFELAIQVFWRPKHLTENNWTEWYSKYLDDERVYGSCGIHPHWSSAWKETSVEDIERCLKHPKVIAIGEIGLDFGPKNTCLMHEQRRAFEAQLKLAAKWLKPIVIHSRNAYEQTFQLMKQYLEPDHKIHLHCFVGTIDDVYLFTSYFTEIKFGFTPIISRTNFLHAVIQQLELTQILSETDSPYFMPDELSTLSRCAHPGMVYSVVETIAQVRRIPIIDVACQLRTNARDIYGV